MTLPEGLFVAVVERDEKENGFELEDEEEEETDWPRGSPSVENEKTRRIQLGPFHEQPTV